MSSRSSISDLRYGLQRQRTRWLLAAALGLLTFGLILAIMQRVERQATELGETESVLVASAPMAAGTVLNNDTAHLENRPRAHVPEHALRELPVGSRTNSVLSTGEIVTSHRTTDARSGAVAAVIGEQSVGVAVPLTPGQLGVEPGDRVALYRAGFDTSTVLVIPIATVVALTETGVIVAVSPTEVKPLIEGLLLNDIVPVLLPGRTPSDDTSPME